MRTNYLQEGGCDRGLSPDSIQEELEEEPLKFKGHERHENHGLEHNYRIILGNKNFCTFLYFISSLGELLSLHFQFMFLRFLGFELSFWV